MQLWCEQTQFGQLFFECQCRWVMLILNDNVLDLWDVFHPHSNIKQIIDKESKSCLGYAIASRWDELNLNFFFQFSWWRKKLLFDGWLDMSMLYILSVYPCSTLVSSVWSRWCACDVWCIHEKIYKLPLRLVLQPYNTRYILFIDNFNCMNKRAQYRLHSKLLRQLT